MSGTFLERVAQSWPAFWDYSAACTSAWWAHPGPPRSHQTRVFWSASKRPRSRHLPLGAGRVLSYERNGWVEFRRRKGPFGNADSPPQESAPAPSRTITSRPAITLTQTEQRHRPLAGLAATQRSSRCIQTWPVLWHLQSTYATCHQQSGHRPRNET